MSHWTLEELLAPIRQLYEEVKRKALMRLEYEGCALPGGARGKALPDPATYAMERYAYYVCHKCGKVSVIIFSKIENFTGSTTIFRLTDIDFPDGSCPCNPDCFSQFTIDYVLWHLISYN